MGGENGDETYSVAKKILEKDSDLELSQNIHI
jgi:hypothetical protein